MEFRVIHPGGAVRWLAMKATVVCAADGTPLYMTGACRDVTRLKRAEEALREETRTLEVLNATGTLLAAQLELEDVLQAVTDAATAVSGARFGAFFYNATNDDGDRFKLYTLSGAPREAFERFGLPRATALFGPTFRGEPPIRIDDVLANPRYGSMGPHHGMPPGHPPVRSYLAVAGAVAVGRGPRRARSSGTRTLASSPSAPSGWCSASPARPASPSTTPASTSRRSAPPRSARRCSTASAPPAPRPSA